MSIIFELRITYMILITFTYILSFENLVIFFMKISIICSYICVQDNLCTYIKYTTFNIIKFMFIYTFSNHLI